MRRLIMAALATLAATFAQGADLVFEGVGKQLIGKPLAILVCGEELIHPVVREPIAGGVGIITQDSLPDALALTARLNGEAPCPEAGGS